MAAITDVDPAIGYLGIVLSAFGVAAVVALIAALVEKIRKEFRK